MKAYNEFLRSIANNEYAGEYEAQCMANFLKSNIYIFNSESLDPLNYEVEGAIGNIYLGYNREHKQPDKLGNIVSHNLCCPGCYL